MPLGEALYFLRRNLASSAALIPEDERLGFLLGFVSTCVDDKDEEEEDDDDDDDDEEDDDDEDDDDDDDDDDEEEEEEEESLG